MVGHLRVRFRGLSKVVGELERLVPLGASLESRGSDTYAGLAGSGCFKGATERVEGDRRELLDVEGDMRRRIVSSSISTFSGGSRDLLRDSARFTAWISFSDSGEEK
jgi:hypothetical protein